MTVRLRCAEMADAALMYAWQSHPTTRIHARNKGMPSYEDHVAWLERKLTDARSAKGCLFYIAEDDGEPVGLVRFDARGGEWETSIVIAPELRGRGLGKATLRAAIAAVPTNATATAYIMPENTASLRLFRSLGFRQSLDGLWRFPPLANEAAA